MFPERQATGIMYRDPPPPDPPHLPALLQQLEYKSYLIEHDSLSCAMHGIDTKIGAFFALY